MNELRSPLEKTSLSPLTVEQTVEGIALAIFQKLISCLISYTFLTFSNSSRLSSVHQECLWNNTGDTHLHLWLQDERKKKYLFTISSGWGFFLVLHSSESTAAGFIMFLLHPKLNTCISELTGFFQLQF